MKPILSKNYYVYFVTDGLVLNNYIKSEAPSRIFILVDENTKEHCLPWILNEVDTAIPIDIIEIESGENAKNLNTCIGLWNTLTELGADRKSLLINVGGGVITDMGGFAASCFKRGIKFINVPTTLLSMVDAAVGSKTGVDLGGLKNQIGLFSNPEMVLINISFLNTLPKREMRSGLAEIIKYGLTVDIKVWNEVKSINTLYGSNLKDLIYKSVAIKNEIVLADLNETGLRKTLNFGHTIGHAIETFYLENERKKTLTHGEAIAIGMIAECYLSIQILNFEKSICNEIKQEILAIFPKIQIDKNDYDEILSLLIHDKKNVNGTIGFVLLKKLGEVNYNSTAEKQQIIEALDYYNN